MSFSFSAFYLWFVAISSLPPMNIHFCTYFVFFFSLRGLLKLIKLRSKFIRGYLYSILHLWDIFTEHRILDLQFFIFLSVLTMLLHCLLSMVASDDIFIIIVTFFLSFSSCFQTEWPSSFATWTCRTEEIWFQLPQRKTWALFSHAHCPITCNV